MAPRWGEDKIDPRIVIGANFGLWIIVSFVIYLLAVPK
jgi:hypothetical protein